jgi:hypothetical protein
MSAEIPATTLQLRSLVKADQTVELFLDTVEVPEPGPGHGSKYLIVPNL